jgi:hypothetical protein
LQEQEVMKRQDLRNIIEEAYYEFLLEVDSEYSPMAYAKKVLNGKMDFFKAREESEIPYSNFISLLKKLDPHYKAPSLAEYNMYERACKMNEAQLTSLLNELETEEFLSAVEDEFDLETLQLMKGIIEKRLTFLKKGLDIANPRTVVKGYIKEAEGDEEEPTEEPAEEELPDTEFADAGEVEEEAPDATADILAKFPTLKKTLVHLMTPEFEEFVEKVGWMSPKPTTFKVEFKNGQDLTLKWMGKGFEATVEGKRYYLQNLSEYQQCLDKITDMLASGPIQSGLGDATGEDIFGGVEGGGGEFPGGETGAAPEAEAGTEAPAGGEEDVFAGVEA